MTPNLERVAEEFQGVLVAGEITPGVVSLLGPDGIHPAQQGSFGRNESQGVTIKE